MTPYPVTAITTGYFMRLVSEGKFPFAKKDSERYKQWIIMMILLANADRKTHHICMSHGEVGDRAGMSESVVRRTFETLRGFFERVGSKGNIPIYRPLLPGLESDVSPKIQQDSADVEKIENTEPFDAVALVAESGKPINGIDADKVRTVVRWHWLQSTNSFWREHIKDAKALHRAVRKMVEQYDKAQEKATSPHRPAVISMTNFQWVPDSEDAEVWGKQGAA